MTDATESPALESLPTYPADGISKQDLSTLQDIQEYTKTVIRYQEQTVDAEELPETAKPVNGSAGQETVVLETVRCGDDTCHCAEAGGKLHGPYLYRYRYDNGSLSSEYLGKPEDNPEIETG